MNYILDFIIINMINNVPDEGDIRDIKGLIIYEIRLKYLIILLILAALICLFIFFRKKRVNIKKEEGKQVLPPDIVAMDRIKKLKESNLIEQGRIKEFYTTLSDIVRVFIEAEYKIYALDLTTYELIIELKNKNIFNGKTMLVQEYLNNCDLVKFAKYIPRKDDSERMLNIAVEIINTAKNGPMENQLEIKSNV